VFREDDSDLACEDVYLNFLIFVLLYVLFFCVVFCIVCVCMCTVLLPPGGYPIAVKYII